MTKNLIFFILISLSNAYNIKSIKGTPSIQERNVTTTTHIDMSLGDVTKGKIIFSKYIRFACGISNYEFAIVHTQDEWEDIAEAGKFKDEIFKICPKLKKIYKDEWSADLYQFLYNYAIDSGNIPLDF